MRRRRAQHGFTLVEVILALALSGMLVLSAYASLRAAMKARDRALVMVGPVRTTQVAMDILRQDLESALPPVGTLAGPFVGELVEGSQGVLSVLTYYSIVGEALSDAVDPASLRRVVLLVVPSEDGTDQVLVRQITWNLLAPIEEEPEQEIVCRGVRRFELRYFDATSGWLETWDSTVMGDVLPLAVEVTLEVQWPPQSVLETDVYRTRGVFPLSCYRLIQTEVSAEGGTEASANAPQP